MNRDEIASTLNAAGVELDSARQSIEAAQDAMERARQAVAHVMGDEMSFTLQGIISALDNGNAKANSVIMSIEGAKYNQTEYISKLYS